MKEYQVPQLHVVKYSTPSPFLLVFWYFLLILNIVYTIASIFFIITEIVLLGFLQDPSFSYALNLFKLTMISKYFMIIFIYIDLCLFSTSKICKGFLFCISVIVGASTIIISLLLIFPAMSYFKNRGWNFMKEPYSWDFLGILIIFLVFIIYLVVWLISPLQKNLAYYKGTKIEFE